MKQNELESHRVISTYISQYALAKDTKKKNTETESVMLHFYAKTVPPRKWSIFLIETTVLKKYKQSKPKHQKGSKANQEDLTTACLKANIEKPTTTTTAERNKKCVTIKQKYARSKQTNNKEHNNNSLTQQIRPVIMCKVCKW